MYSIHFHIHMLDKKHIQPTAAILPAEVSSPIYTDLMTLNHSSQYPHLISPINKHEYEPTPCPAAH